MTKEEVYKKALELADKALAEISKEELNSLFQDVDNKAYCGPTFDEYLELLNNEFIEITPNYIVCNELNDYSFNEMWCIDDDHGFVDIKPPPLARHFKEKEDSAILWSLFF